MTDVQGAGCLHHQRRQRHRSGHCTQLCASGRETGAGRTETDALARARDELEQVTAVETYRLDVRDRAAYAAIADEALGPVSLLFNNAGVAGGAPAEKIAFPLWDWGIGIDLYGVDRGWRA